MRPAVEMAQTTKPKILLGQLILGMGLLGDASSLYAQVRFYQWHWEVHPLWAGVWAVVTIVLILLFWVIVLIGFVVGVRWLFRRRPPTGSDSALTILRDRYARSEIDQEEFEQKLKDLS